MNIQWSGHLAYAVGLIATDGNLSSDGRHLELTSKDIEQIRTFKRCLNLKNRIGWKTSGYSSKRYPRIQFGNVRLYNWLMGIGLMPRKSKRLGALEIPDAYFFDFLRGCLDGDGCVRTFQDPVYPKAQRLYIIFSSGSRPYVEWIQKRVQELLGMRGFLSSGTRNRVWELTFAKKASQKLLKALYHRDNIPYLKRKYRIAEPFL